MSEMMKVENLSVYRDGKPILHDINFSLEKNKFIGIIGPNGAGKSTLLGAMAAFLPAQQGAIFVEDQSLEKMNRVNRARLISYLPQARPVHWVMTVEDIVMLGRYAWGEVRQSSVEKNAVDQKAVDIALIKTHTDHLRSRQIDSLSGGERARVHLARALAGSTPVLLADEPTSALDPGHQFSMMIMLQNHAYDNRLVVAAVHDLDLAARYCDVLLVLDQGQLVAQGVPEKILTPDLLHQIFQIDGQFTGSSEERALMLRPLQPV